MLVERLLDRLAYLFLLGAPRTFSSQLLDRLNSGSDMLVFCSSSGSTSYC